jgi:hypothetical protein
LAHGEPLPLPALQHQAPFQHSAPLLVGLPASHECLHLDGCFRYGGGIQRFTSGERSLPKEGLGSAQL